MAGQLWSVNNLGGYMSSAKLSKVLRHAVQPLVKFRQFADIKDATMQGKHKGHEFTWNVYSRVAQKGGKLVETDAMPETNFTITQGRLLIDEFGNSVPYTEKLDNLSEHPLKTVIHKVLKEDAKQAFDDAAHEQFNQTPLVVSPGGGGSATDSIMLNTDGTPATKNNVALGKNHVKCIVDMMAERNIPPYVNDDYVAIAHPTTFRQLKNDLEQLHQYVETGFRMILNGEIGRYEGVRFVEQTSIPKETWENNKSNWAFFFGDDTVAEAIAVPEEIRGKIPTDYGRSRGVAWYYLGGFGIVHPRNDADGSMNARIVKWGSQES